jgi:hypothetical protein
LISRFHSCKTILTESGRKYRKKVGTKDEKLQEYGVKILKEVTMTTIYGREELNDKNEAEVQGKVKSKNKDHGKDYSVLNGERIQNKEIWDKGREEDGNLR